MRTVTFKFDEFEILEEKAEEYAIFKTVGCEVDLLLVEEGLPAVMPSLNEPGEPEWPAEWEITEIRLTDENSILVINETDFITFFAGGADVINNALEWAATQEIEYE